MNNRAKNKSKRHQRRLSENIFAKEKFSVQWIDRSVRLPKDIWLNCDFVYIQASQKGRLRVQTMDGGGPAGVRRVCRSIAFVFFMVTSSYLVLELVIALSAQGEPTGAMAPFSGAEVTYPNWYEAPEFIDAVWVSLVAYPAAAVFYGVGAVAGWIGRAVATEQPRMAPLFPAPASVSPAGANPVSPPEPMEGFCVVSADRRIQHMASSTAHLFGRTPRDMLGQSLEVFLAPVDLPKLDALVAAAYADSPRAFAATVGIVLPDAAVSYVDITCRAGASDAASFGAFAITVRPLSERGQLGDQLAALWY